MSENNYLKNINFVDFMADNQVVIPLIQREYAQGRNNAQGEEVRKNFVPELIKVLTGEKESLKLDFVFGVKEDGTFIPLDGQQRLTTLLLLHWYFGAHKGKNWSFTYESRRMANSFVNGLLNAILYNREDTPSKWIKKQEWFFENWLTDPTVSGMLTMLDEIHKKADEEDCRSDNLNNITFYLYPIEQLDADNAYTKMNARGEPLTQWENIKALLDKKNQAWTTEHANCVLSQWVNNIDGDWLSNLEKYAGLEPNKLQTDDELESAIKRINCAFRNIFDLAVCIDLAMQIDENRDRKIKDEIAENISKFHSHEALLSDYQTHVTRQTFKIAVDLFHALCDRPDVFKLGWTKDRAKNCFWGYDKSDADADFTKDFLFNENASYENSVRFFVLSLANSDNERIRVILNLLDNSENIGKESFSQVITGITKLISDGVLEEVLKSLTFFNSKQIAEEINKCKIADKSWFEFEKHPLLYGSIGFLWDGEKFSSERYTFFDKTFTQDKTWQSLQFYKLLEYYDEKLTDAVYVPNDNAEKWRKLFRQNNARKAFARMANPNRPKQIIPQWIEFFVKHHVNNYRLVPYCSDIYDYNTDYKISGNAVRLNYKSAELKLLEIITPSYLCFGQSEAKINSEKCNCNWNENVTDKQRQNAKIKLHETREGKYTIYDDKDNAIGTLILQADDAEKS